MKTLSLTVLLILAACATPETETPSATEVTPARFYACMGAFQVEADTREGTFIGNHPNIRTMYNEGQKKYGFTFEERTEGSHRFANTIHNYPQMSREDQLAFIRYCSYILGATPVEVKPEKVI